jgi:hypothetical protein
LTCENQSIPKMTGRIKFFTTKNTQDEVMSSFNENSIHAWNFMRELCCPECPRRCRDQSPLGYNVAHSLLESTGSAAMIHPPVPKIENPGQQEYLSSPNPAVTNLILGNVEVCLAFNGREHLPSPSCRRFPIGDLSGLAPRKGGASSVSPTAADETILRGVGPVRRGASFVRWRFGGCSTDCRSRKSRASWIDLSPRGFSVEQQRDVLRKKLHIPGWAVSGCVTGWPAP